MNRKRALVAKAPKDYKLLWMAMPFIVIVFLFSYVPIFGWIYSFFDYVPGVSIFDCDFVGLDYFKLIFNDDNVLRSLKNTFIFALINICLTALEESAALDGAGYITCFFKIILPLCKPIIATVVVFVAVGQWNSWFDNHIYTRANESLTTLQYLLYNYLNEAQRLAEQLKTASSGADMTQAMAAISPKGIRMTITVLASLPIFALYPFMQKYFSKGIMVGAVKG